MKRCLICDSFASNDATTCFDCLYSFEHMAPLDQDSPNRTNGTSRKSRKERASSPEQPAPPQSQSALPKRQSSLETVAERVPEQKPAEPRTHKPITIIITIDPGTANVVVSQEM